MSRNITHICAHCVRPRPPRPSDVARAPQTHAVWRTGTAQMVHSAASHCLAMLLGVQLEAVAEHVLRRDRVGSAQLLVAVLLLALLERRLLAQLLRCELLLLERQLEARD